MLADEVLTPDSSRFWPADRLGAGPAAGLVRQAVRPRLVGDAATGTAPPPGPAVPAEVVDGHPRPLRRGLRADHRPALARLITPRVGTFDSASRHVGRAGSRVHDHHVCAAPTLSASVTHRSPGREPTLWWRGCNGCMAARLIVSLPVARRSRRPRCHSPTPSPSAACRCRCSSGRWGRTARWRRGPVSWAGSASGTPAATRWSCTATTTAAGRWALSTGSGVPSSRRSPPTRRRCGSLRPAGSWNAPDWRPLRSPRPGGGPPPGTMTALAAREFAVCALEAERAPARGTPVAGPVRGRVLGFETGPRGPEAMCARLLMAKAGTDGPARRPGAARGAPRRPPPARAPRRGARRPSIVVLGHGATGATYASIEARRPDGPERIRGPRADSRCRTCRLAGLHGGGDAGSRTFIVVFSGPRRSKWP